MLIPGSDCYYDEENGYHYMGRTSAGHRSGMRRSCIHWIQQNRRPDSLFPDGSRSAAGHYCRNPDKYDIGPWCYYNTNYNWVTCEVKQCRAYSKNWQ